MDLDASPPNKSFDAFDLLPSLVEQECLGTLEQIIALRNGPLKLSPPHSSDSEDAAYGESHQSTSGIDGSLESDSGVVCQLCNETVATSDELAQHVAKEHPPASRRKVSNLSKQTPEKYPHVVLKYVCGTCGTSVFDSQQEVQQHMIEEHGLEEKPLAGKLAAGFRSKKKQAISEDDLNGVSSATSYVSSPVSRFRSYSSSTSSDAEYGTKPTTKSKRCQQSRKRRHAPQPSSEETREEFLKSVTLKSLTEKFHGERPHRCPRKGCQFKFASFEIREQHLRCHAENDATSEPPSGTGAAGGHRKRFNFKCHHCDKKFDSWKPCLVHLWREHETDLGMLRCPLCEKRFVYGADVFRHLQTHRPKEMRDVECGDCGKKFANASQRAVHEALHRKRQPESKEEPVEEKQRWYSERRCNVCNHMFSNSKILSKHIKTVHLKIKPFVCNVCGYKCARKATLNIHIRQHSGLKPLACKSCPFRTADPSTLSYHERRHRQDKSYQCETCGIKVVQPSTLRIHIQTQHPAEYERMKCTLCEFVSINTKSRQRHQANHEAGLIQMHDDDSRPESTTRGHRTPHGGSSSGVCTTTNGRPSENAPESSSDCFLPLESVDSVVHDTGGITIPAAVVTIPAALSEETQFPI